MNRIDLIQELILKGQDQNHTDHARIEAKLSAMEEKVSLIRVRVAGISGGIAVAVTMLVRMLERWATS
jgi:hypothetical protein